MAKMAPSGTQHRAADRPRRVELRRGSLAGGGCTADLGRGGGMKQVA